MPMQAWFPDETRSVEPGDSLRLVLTVENPTRQADTFTITPAGMNVSWITVSEPSVTLAGGASRVVDVWVHPTRMWTTPAGPNEISVRIIAESDPTVALTCDAVVVVEAFDRRSIAVLQPVIRARRRATFEVVVGNDGNEMANCRLRLIDPSQRCEGAFDPPMVGVSPGESNVVRLRARIRGGRFRRSERVVSFQIDASESGYETVTTTATVVQPPTLAEGWIVRFVAALGVVAALTIGWLFFLRNWVDDRVDRAVDERVAAVRVDDTGEVTEVVPAEDPPPVANAPDELGTPVSIRLMPEAAPLATGVDTYVVEGATTLYLTDLVLQNPSRDDGRAVLSIGDETLYEWDLSEMSGLNEFQPRITPLPVPAGSELRFSVLCGAVGADDETVCRAAILMTGRLAPAGS